MTRRQYRRPIGLVSLIALVIALAHTGSAIASDQYRLNWLDSVTEYVGLTATASEAPQTADGSSNLSTSGYQLTPPNAPTGTLYNWNAVGGGSYTTATNWTPTRTTPATDDILQFPSGTYTVTGVPTETIGQLFASGGGTNVTLQPAAGLVTLTIAGGVGDDLVVQASNSLNISGGTTNTNTLKILLASGAATTIRGTMTFSGAQHQIDAGDASGLTFASGSTFTYNPGGTAGNPFTNAGTASSVVFQSGSTYVFQGGANPFALTAPASKVVFQTGSLFQQTGSGTPSFSGRTYANYELNNAAAVSVNGGTAMSIDNITVTQGTLNYNMTGVTGHTIKGNISVATGATLNFAPASAGTVNLNGPSGQLISGAGTISTTANSTLNISNSTPQGVILQRSLAITGGVLSVASGAMLVCGTNAVTGTGTFTLSSGGTLGIGDPNGITASTASGNIQTATRSFSTGATYIYNGSANQNAGDGLPSTVNNLTIANSGAAGNNFVFANASQTVSGLLSVQFGNYSGNTGVYKDVQIAGSGTYTANNSLSVSGNWTTPLSGNVYGRSGSGIVTTFNGAGGQTILGSTNFGDLAITGGSRQITFQAGSLTGAANSLTLTGSSGNLLILRSSSTGTRWQINAGSTQSVGFVDVKDSDASGGSSIIPSAGTSIDSGNNLNWTFATPPTVTSISPTSGPAAGGTVVTINGSGFTGATQVHFGAQTASFTFVNDTQMTATAPAGSGTVDVTVTTPGGTSVTTASDQYTYLTPTIVVPNALLGFGTQTVGNVSQSQGYTVSGTNLTGNITVTAPSGFQVSTDPATGFGPSVSLPPTGGSVNASVYVRWAPTFSTGGVQLNLIMTASSPGAVTQNNPRVSGISVPATCAAQPSGMVAWYQAEGNALDSRGASNGTLQNGATFAGGKVGQSLSFDGVDDYVAIPITPSLAIGNAMTYDAWVRVNATAANYQTVFSSLRTPALDNGMLITVPPNSTTLQLYVSSGASFNVPNFFEIGQFTHTAVTTDAGTTNVYKNGSLVATFSTPTLIAPTSRITFGLHDNSIAPEPFGGQIDEVEIFNRALTGPEIGGLYDASTAGKCTLTGASGPAAWYSGDGDFRDISGNNNNATAVGSQVGFTVGKVGQAMTFTGDVTFSRVQVPDSATLNPTSAMSLEGWVYPTTDSFSTNAMAVMLNKEVSGTGQYEIARRLSSAACPSGGGIPTGHFAVYIGGLTGLPDDCGGWVDGLGSLPLNAWSHVAVTYDGSHLNTYVNGAQTRSIAATGTIQVTSGQLVLGGRSTNAETWIGKEDEMSIYGRGLTAAEVQSVFNAGSAGKYKSVATPIGASVSSNAGGDATANFTGVATQGQTQQVPIDPTGYPALPQPTALGLYYDIGSSASFTGGVKVCFHLPLVATASVFNNLRIDHFEGGAWADRTDIASINFAARTVCTTSLGSLSPFAIGVAAPTAAGVTISGRVLAPGGGGLRNATVVMTGADGNTRRALTNAFGYYTFSEVQSGGSYIMGVESRRFTYATRVLQVTDALANVDFAPID